MKSSIFLIPVIFLISCKDHVDTIYYNATIYTVNNDDSVCHAIAVKNGKIVSIGDKDALFEKYDAKNNVDLNGKFVYPGFIDSHCHFLDYGINRSQLNLQGASSWTAVLDKIRNYASSHPNGWIIGYGWNQHEWTNNAFPLNNALNKLFPNRPIFLKSTDLQACIVNEKALELAGITAKTIIPGGKIIIKKGKLTGILLDNAVDSIEKIIPEPTAKEIGNALLTAQQNCFSVGLTTVDDAGLTKQLIDDIDTLQKRGDLKMRIYAMLSDNNENRNYYFKHGTYKTDRLHVCAFKFYVDGALGSWTALLLKPYSDSLNERGLQLKPTAYFEKQAQLCYKYGFQMCTHAIGDSANHLIVGVYASVLKGHNDKRWRIGGCQVIAPDDFQLFADYDIVPSVQTTRATDELFWAEDRIGIYRLQGAYAYRILLYKSGYIINGSGFPAEDINPLYGFYAAVSRQDQKGYPPGGFQPENGLTRQQALYAMTIWVAKANFEDNEKGSIEPGKFADFVVLDKDIMTIPIEQTLTTKVSATYVDGEKVFGK
jgi:predicted amidohydrolase YtcJ